GVEFKMFFISFIPRSHESTLFPYTTLFRSRHRFAADMGGGRVAALRVAGGAAEVVALENGTPVRSLYRASEGESVSGIAASGERVVITALRAGVWALVDISDGTPRVLVADEAIKHSPRFGQTPNEV